MLDKYEEAFEHLSILHEIIQDEECRNNLAAFLKVLSDEIAANDDKNLIDQDIEGRTKLINLSVKKC